MSYRIFEAKKLDFPENGNILYGFDCPSAKFLLQKLEMCSITTLTESTIHTYSIRRRAPSMGLRPNYST